jgi:hypothetical protein
MQIPETPKSIEDLDLMKRLKAYAEGCATWLEQGEPGPELRAACRTLHNNIFQLGSSVLGHILDRVTAREMDTFTMHDHTHGLKVAHLMWHIPRGPSARASYTP